MNNNEAAGKNKDEAAGIDFLDFLFTLAISIGLSPGILGIADWSGLLSEEWLKQGVLPSGQARFDFAVFALGFLTLTLSWFGYHGSIRKKPLQYGTLHGLFRFVCDVLLVVIYGLILLEYKRFSIVLGLIIFIHVVFVVWDFVKIFEHPDKYQRDGKSHLQVYRREYVSLVYFVLFCVVWFFSPSPWTSVIIAILLTVLYRINKEIPLWERLFGINAA